MHLKERKPVKEATHTKEKEEKKYSTYFSTIYVFNSSFSEEKVYEVFLSERTNKVRS